MDDTGQSFVSEVEYTLIRFAFLVLLRSNLCIEVISTRYIIRCLLSRVMLGLIILRIQLFRLILLL